MAKTKSDEQNQPEQNQYGNGFFQAAREEVGERADSVRCTGAPAIAKHKKSAVNAGSKGRIAIVDACRTPFTKAGGEFNSMDVVDLSSVAAGELIRRSGIDPNEIDLSIFGVVVPALAAPNLGREVVLRTTLPKSIPGATVNLACASSNRAITQGAEAILSGQAEIVLAGGAESLSTVPITYSRNASQRFIELSKAKSVGARIWRPTPRPLPTTPPAKPWASRPRRWRKRTPSRVAPRTRSRSILISAPPPPTPRAVSTARSWPPFRSRSTTKR